MENDSKYLVGAYYPMNSVEFVITLVEHSGTIFTCDGSKGVIDSCSDPDYIYSVAKAAGFYVLPEKFKVENFNTACIALRDSLNNLLKELNTSINLESLVSKAKKGDCTFMFGEEYEIAKEVLARCELLINESERRLREKISLKIPEPGKRSLFSFATDCLYISGANRYKDLCLKYKELQKQKEILEGVYYVITGFGLERTKTLFPLIKENLFPFVSSFEEYADLVDKKRKELKI